MDLDFDFKNVKTKEFGVGLDEVDGQKFRSIAVDGDVKSALWEMAVDTWNSMCETGNQPQKYDPSEKYESSEYVYLPLGDELADRMRYLQNANNLQIDSAALADPTKIFCYFVRITDDQGRRLTALRRATHFKGILKSRLIRWITDALKIIEDDVFKLDKDFDLLIDTSNVHILRPSAFEFVALLQEAVLEAVSSNIKSIQDDLTFVDLSSVQDYASKHPRAARYLASIRSRKQTENVDMVALKNTCLANSVEIKEVDGKIVVLDGNVLGFLEVLDRRRYNLELVKGSSERYKASSRRKIE